MIYISARDKDKKIVEILRQTFEQEGNIIVSYEDIKVGANYTEWIFDKIKQAKQIVFIISKGYEKSEFMNAEISFAFNEMQKRNSKTSIIPIIIGDDFDPPFFIKQLSFIRIDNEHTAESQLAAIRNRLAHSTSNIISNKDNYSKITQKKKYLEEEKKAYELALIQKRSKLIIAFMRTSIITVTIGIAIVVAVIFRDYLRNSQLIPPLIGIVLGASGMFANSKLPSIYAKFWRKK